MQATSCAAVAFVVLIPMCCTVLHWLAHPSSAVQGECQLSNACQICCQQILSVLTVLLGVTLTPIYSNCSPEVIWLASSTAGASNAVTQAKSCVIVLMLLLTGAHAPNTAVTEAAISQRSSQAHLVLNQLLDNLRTLARSSAHGQKAHRHRGRRRDAGIKKLKQRLVKQALQIRRQKAQQAQHAQRVTRLEEGMQTAGLQCYHKVEQLAKDVTEGHLQQRELSSQVRANTRAQDCWCGWRVLWMTSGRNCR